MTTKQKEYIEFIEEFSGVKSDKVEPKFKVGDWITNGKLLVGQITSFDGEYYHYMCNGVQQPLHISNTHKWHLWTIQDVKDGDVLALEWKDECQWQKIVIFKSLNEFGVEGYGNTFKNNKLAFKEDIPFYSKTWTKYLHPATKEQRDLLFQKMKEAGYEMIIKLKELNLL